MFGNGHVPFYRYIEPSFDMGYDLWQQQNVQQN
jgi:hypothetical protein